MLPGSKRKKPRNKKQPRKVYGIRFRKCCEAVTFYLYLRLFILQLFQQLSHIFFTCGPTGRDTYHCRTVSPFFPHLKADALCQFLLQAVFKLYKQLVALRTNVECITVYFQSFHNPVSHINGMTGNFQVQAICKQGIKLQT